MHDRSCIFKPKLCEYCKCYIKASGYSDHIYSCGSRTNKCPSCGKNILVRGIIYGLDDIY